MSNVVMIIMMIAFGFIVAEIAKSKGYVLKSGEKKRVKRTCTIILSGGYAERLHF